MIAASSTSSTGNGSRGSAPRWTRLFLCWTLVVIGHCGGLPGVAQQADPALRSAAQMLPESVVLYAEMPQPSTLVETVLQHPQRERLESLPEFQAALQSDEALQLKAGLSVFEAGMGKRWPQVLGELTQGGVAVAFDAHTEGAVLLAKAKEPQVIVQLRETLFSLIRAGKLAGSEADPIQSAEYRGITAYKVAPQLYVAQLDDWILATNKGELGKAVIDNYHDRDSGGLFATPDYSLALADRSGKETLWGFGSISSIRESGAAPELYSGRTENIIAELLFGGLMSTLQNTSFATLGIDVTETQFAARVQVPHEAAWAGEARAYYFGESGQAAVEPAPRVDNQLFTISLHRDLSEMWLWAGDLLTEKGSDELAQADSQLSLFFGGRDFGEDILSLFSPQVHLVGARQVFDDQQPTPSIQLPAFALVLEMEDDEQTQADLRRVFQSVVGFLNIAGAMNGQPQLDLGLESQTGYRLVTATYVTREEDRLAKDADIQYNFSPTLGFNGRRMILASTTGFARSLALSQETPARDESHGEQAAINSLVELDADVLHAILASNRQQLVAQNMIEKGHSPDQAESEIGLLFELLKLFQQARLELVPSEDRLQLQLDVMIH